ncbi:MAG: LysM peptidoglycan-binding domain-containing protein, partial [Aggregatilineales bacterium]
MIFKYRYSFWCVVGLCLLLVACVREQPEVIVITATFPAAPQVVVPGETAIPAVIPTQPPVSPVALSPVPDNLPVPTLNPVSEDAVEIPSEHVVRAGDTLFEIASQYGISSDALLSTNNLTNPDLLSVGQVLILPDTPTEQSVSFKMIPDSRLVRAPGSRDFDIAAFINIQPGYIRQVTDVVPVRIASGGTVDRRLSAAQIIQRISLEYSLDARLLLVLLEYTAGWLSNPAPSDDLKVFPLISAADSGGINRSGMYKQLAWAANQLNAGYYGWKYRGLRSLNFEDGKRLTFAAGLNPGTIALQYFFSLNEDFQVWLQKVDADGFYNSYFSYFGNPFD